ncbi:MAG: hypothetical protein ABIV36_24360 [Sphingobium limneticum]
MSGTDELNEKKPKGRHSKAADEIEQVGPMPDSGCRAGTRLRVLMNGDTWIEGAAAYRVRAEDRVVTVNLDDGTRATLARGLVRVLPTSREDIIRFTRETLAERAAADPAAWADFNARSMRLTMAAKRQRQRLDHLVMGVRRPLVPAVRSKRQGRRKIIEKARPIEIDPGIDAALDLRDAWSHKQGTPETLEKAGMHHDCLLQLVANGTIDKEQEEWASQIANVHRSIEADVKIGIASLEARVDNDRGGADRVAEGIRRVRLHHAYTLWREQIPAPKHLVLSMIVGDAIGYTVAAKIYGVGNVKAKTRLIDALNRWPDCVERAHRLIDEADVERLNSAA